MLCFTRPRVTAADSEGEWLSCLEGKTTRAVLAELKDAQKKKRATPRKDAYGLPGLCVKLTFDLSPAEHAVVEAGLAKTAREMGESLAGAHASPQEALLYLMHRLLATDPEGKVELPSEYHYRWPALPMQCVELSPRCRSGRNGDLAARQREKCCVATEKTVPLAGLLRDAIRG